jgi:hypothetical protein
MDTLGCPQTKSARVFPMREGEFYQPCARAEGFSWEFHYEPRYEEWESSADAAALGALQSVYPVQVRETPRWPRSWANSSPF